MNRHLLTTGIFALMLVSCGNSAVEDISNTGSGGVVEQKKEIEEIKEKEEREDSEAVDATLAQSYEDALRVRDAVLEAIPKLEGELKAEMESVMIIFNDHIDALRYFVDESQQRELTPEETEKLLQVLEDTAIMIELFGQVFETLEA